MSEDHSVALAPDRPEHNEPIALAVLADAVGATVLGSADGVEVTGFTLSSQRVRPGDLYAALPGSRSHGISFAAAAAEAGAVAVLTDPEGAASVDEAVELPLLVVDAPRALLGPTAARIYGDPAGAMRMIGVTGTQGKTTTTLLAEGGMSAAGIPAGVIGTVGTRIGGREVKTSLTTPEAPDLHGLFAVMREQGIEVCAMEVSSHALVLGRVDGVVFDVAVFLNLGRDHLDFHTDVDDYFAAKASLFTPERARLALINLDDEHGRRLADETSLPVRTMSSSGRTADWWVDACGADGVRVALCCPCDPAGSSSPPAVRCPATSTSRTPSRPSRHAARRASMPPRWRPASSAPARCPAGSNGSRRGRTSS